MSPKGRSRESERKAESCRRDLGWKSLSSLCIHKLSRKNARSQRATVIFRVKIKVSLREGRRHSRRPPSRTSIFCFPSRKYHPRHAPAGAFRSSPSVGVANARHFFQAGRPLGKQRARIEEECPVLVKKDGPRPSIKVVYFIA